jgi:hypothetical protein
MFNTVLFITCIAINAVKIVPCLSPSISFRFPSFSTLNNKKNNWVDNIDKLVVKHNNTAHVALGDVKPSEANEAENVATIAKINYKKGLKNDTVTDLEIGDKVRINIKGTFDKGTEPQFSNKVYSVIKIVGQTIYLNNGEKKKRYKLLKVDKDAKDIEKTIVKQAKQERKSKLIQKKEDIKQDNIIREPRIRKANSKYL